MDEKAEGKCGSLGGRLGRSHVKVSESTLVSSTCK